MKRTLLLISILLLSASWAMAQRGGGYSSNESSDSNANSSNVTVLGCLSEDGGNFTLTDQTGTTYLLIGKTEKLSAHVGHTMKVTGISTFAAQVPGSMSNGVETPPTLSVTSFKHVSSNCGETSGTGSY